MSPERRRRKGWDILCDALSRVHPVRGKGYARLEFRKRQSNETDCLPTGRADTGNQWKVVSCHFQRIRNRISISNNNEREPRTFDALITNVTSTQPCASSVTCLAREARRRQRYSKVLSR